MNLHANAALSLNGRRELCRDVVERQRTLTQAAEAAGVSVRCARKWVGRYRAEGEPGLRDRSSAPHRVPHRTGEQRVAATVALRRVCGSPARRSPRSSTCRSRPSRGS
jgi:transposase